MVPLLNCCILFPSFLLGLIPFFISRPSCFSQKLFAQYHLLFSFNFTGFSLFFTVFRCFKNALKPIKEVEMSSTPFPSVVCVK